jgi:hypothetical protein
MNMTSFFALPHKGRHGGVARAQQQAYRNRTLSLTSSGPFATGTCAHED